MKKLMKEGISYLFFGVLTFLVSMVTYAFFDVRLGLNELVANVLSWVIAVTFAFLTNRSWVFEVKDKEVLGFFKQAVSFFSGRLVTLGVEEVILLVFVTWLAFDSLLIKLIAQAIVIVLNYVLSKFWIFKKTEGDK